MPVQPGVQIEGLREVQRMLRRIDRSLGPELRKAGNRAAADVVRDAKFRASTRMERAAAETLRGGSTQRGAGVRLGRAKVPFALGAEFGARGRYGWYSKPQYSGSGGRQFRPWSGNKSDAGYFLYPAIRANAPRLRKRYIDEINKLIARAT